MRRKAFTLAEVMIVLVILGVLAAILIPVITKAKPDKNKIMFKKGYYVAERVINELINDETYYNDEDSIPAFFADESSVTIDGVATTAYDGTKFCKLFASKLNTIGEPVCTVAASTYASGNNTLTGTFTTTDGITWFIPVAQTGPRNSLFTDPNESTLAVGRNIKFDINGITPTATPTSPNCRYDASTPTVCTKPDQFTITVRYNGKIIVDWPKEMEYLKDLKIQSN